MEACQTPIHGRMNPSGISVIIPSYNSAEVLPAAIESVLAQTLPPDEIIVVDDGSAPDADGMDRTADVCAPYFKHVRLIRQANGGASAARNTGIARSHGGWLAFLDADDVWEPEKLATQVAAMRQNPEADFCITAARVWSESEQTFVTMSYDGPLDPARIQAALLVRNVFTGLCSSMLARREAIESVGGFASGRACEDRRIAIELLRRHRALILPTPLIRQQPGPAHWRDPRKHGAEMERLIADYAELFRVLDPSGRLRRRAVARVHERTGMHYLENGDLPTAAKHLRSAALMWPFMANPWRVLVNYCLGRLRGRAASASKLAG